MGAIEGSGELARFVWRKSGLKLRWKSWRFERVMSEWRVLRATLARATGSRELPPAVLFIPPDPLLLTDSRGDQAMILVLLGAVREHFPGAKLCMLTHGPQASQRARDLGIRPIQVEYEGKLAHAFELCRAEQITHSITIGADVLDGSYDPVFSAELLALTDLLARSGVRCAVNGFSFSDKPFPGLASIYGEFCKDVVFNLRDPVSFKRFRAFSSAAARLTADVAFLLKPAHDIADVPEFGKWIARQRAEGRTVLGVNIHPLLLDLDQRHRVPEMCAAFSRVLGRLLETHPIALVLLEHDFRGTSSDYLCIDRIEDGLRGAIPNLVYRFPKPLSAAEVKCAVGALDGVVTGRMHLSIATLGAGVPVFLIDYKAKMEGLLQHFGIDRELRIVAKNLFDEQLTFSAINRFAERLPVLRGQVAERLPAIKRMALSNLDPVLQSADWTAGVK